MYNIEDKDKILDHVDNLYKQALEINPQNGLVYYFLAANACWRNKEVNEIKPLLEKSFHNDSKLKEIFKSFDIKNNGPFEKISQKPEIMQFLME